MLELICRWRVGKASICVSSFGSLGEYMIDESVEQRLCVESESTSVDRRHCFLV